jgi:hypothetical protein
VPLRKTILPFLLSITLNGYGTDPGIKTDSGTVIISLQNASDRQSQIDSIYLIFDRYDKRGAGIIKQVFHPKNNQVEITVPKGRYYVNIYCLGIYNRAGFDRIVNAKPKRKSKIFLLLQASALFTPGMVEIPREKWDPAHLAIMESHASR